MKYSPSSKKNKTSIMGPLSSLLVIPRPPTPSSPSARSKARLRITPSVQTPLKIVIKFTRRDARNEFTLTDEYSLK